MLLLTPALSLLAVFIVYPIGYSVATSMRDERGDGFVGLANYKQLLTDPHIVTAIRNTAVWVVVGPTVVCALGLLFAVLVERVRWATAFRVVLFMPMAISLFASGVIFRLVYEEQPELGIANAVTVGVHDLVTPPARYPGSRPRDPGTVLTAVDPSQPWRPAVLADGDRGPVTTEAYQDGDVVAMPLVGGGRPLPEQALPATIPAPSAAELRGLVWYDAVLPSSGRGRVGRPEPGERGMPLVTVEAIGGSHVVATATTGDDGTFVFPDLPTGSYHLRLAADNFTPPFRGHTWLGAGLITPVIISCWVWIMTGFALTFVAVGLSAIPREVVEASRVDGATEAKILRRVTIPLLSPVLVVVFVTLVITVLKAFDLVYVIAPGSMRDEATVLAMEIWRLSFNSGQAMLGSALCVVLLLLVTPAMLFNISRFRRERS